MAEERPMQVEEEHGHEFEETIEDERTFLIDVVHYIYSHRNFKDIVDFPPDDDSSRWNSGFSSNIGKAVLATRNLFYLYREAGTCYKCHGMTAMLEAEEKHLPPKDLGLDMRLLDKCYIFHTLAYVCEYYSRHEQCSLATLLKSLNKLRENTNKLRILQENSCDEPTTSSKETTGRPTSLQENPEDKVTTSPEKTTSKPDTLKENSDSRETTSHEGSKDESTISPENRGEIITHDFIMAVDSFAEVYLEGLVETKRCQCYLRMPTDKFLSNLFEFFSTQRYPKPKLDTSHIENSGFTRDIGEAVIQTWHLRLGFEFLYDPEDCVKEPASARPRPVNDPDHYMLSGMSRCLDRIMLEREHRECLFEFLALASQRHLESTLLEPYMTQTVERAAAALMEKMVWENYRSASRPPCCEECWARGETLLRSDYEDMDARAKAYLRSLDKIKRCLCLERAFTPMFFTDLLEFYQLHRGCRHIHVGGPGGRDTHFTRGKWESRFTANVGEACFRAHHKLGRRHAWLEPTISQDVESAMRLTSRLGDDGHVMPSPTTPEDHLHSRILSLVDPLLEEEGRPPGAAPFLFYAVACKYCTACELKGAFGLVQSVLNLCAVWTDRFLGKTCPGRDKPCSNCKAQGRTLKFQDFAALDSMAVELMDSELLFEKEVEEAQKATEKQ